MNPVLTTIVILVASVVLGTGVVLYGTSLYQTQYQAKNNQENNVTQNHQVYCQALYDNLTKNIQEPKNLTSTGVRLDKIISVVGMLLDQDVNKTVNHDLTVFRNACINGTGNVIP